MATVFNLSDGFIAHDKRTIPQTVPFVIGALNLTTVFPDTIPDDGLSLGDSPVFAPVIGDGLSLGDSPDEIAFTLVGDGLSVGDSPDEIAFTLVGDGLSMADALDEFVFALGDGATLSDEIVFALVTSDGIVFSEEVVIGELPGRFVELQGQSDDQATEVILNLVVGDTLPVLLFVLLDENRELYQTLGATVTLKAKLRDAATYKINSTLDYVSTTGWWQYRLTSADTDAAGEYEAELIIAWTATAAMTTEKFLIRIRERI